MSLILQTDFLNILGLLRNLYQNACVLMPVMRAEQPLLVCFELFFFYYCYLCGLNFCLSTNSCMKFIAFSASQPFSYGGHFMKLVESIGAMLFACEVSNLDYESAAKKL